jgi:hypothetical protein
MIFRATTLSGFQMAQSNGIADREVISIDHHDKGCNPTALRSAQLSICSYVTATRRSWVRLICGPEPADDEGFGPASSLWRNRFRLEPGSAGVQSLGGDCMQERLSIQIEINKGGSHVNNTVILTLLLLMLTFPPIAMGDPTFSNAVIQGQYKCVLTAYGLPAKANEPFAVTATGDITVAADGNGKLTGGTWDHTIDAPGAHMGCKLTMSDGTYSINSDGSGAENTKWQLLKNDSSPDCSTYFPDAPAGTAQLVVTNPEGKTFYTSSLSPFAILAVACQK